MHALLPGGKVHGAVRLQSELSLTELTEFTEKGGFRSLEFKVWNLITDYCSYWHDIGIYYLFLANNT